MAYSPFSNDRSKLIAADLSSLKTAHEGWYIEYKAEVSRPANIAKSISAMANTYGGWVFYGVQEKSKDENVAGSCPGVPVEDLDKYKQHIRQSVKEHISPDCHFEIYVIGGENKEMGLRPNHVVIAIEVLESANTPHIHSSGKIYRRVGDSSEPGVENDRHALDLLWQRRKTIEQGISRWVERVPEVSEAERDICYIRLLLATDLVNDNSNPKRLDFEAFKEIAGSPGGGFTSILFDNFYSTPAGFVARSANGNNPFGLVTTMQVCHNLDCEVVLPLSSGNIEPLLKGKGYKHSVEFNNLINESGFSPPKVVDLNYLLLTVTGIVNTYERILEKSGWEKGFLYKLQLENFWRTVPFIDTPSFMHHVRTNGFPLPLFSSYEFPKGSTIDSFLDMGDMKASEPLPNEAAEKEVNNYVKSAQITLVTLNILGVPLTKQDTFSEIYDLANSLVDAHQANRAALTPS